MKLLTCPICSSDDIGLQESKPLETVVTEKYSFTTWFCIFFCHQCGREFESDLDDDERKDYL